MPPGQAIADRVGWRRWFGAQRIEPFGVGYEELVADMVGTTRRVLAFLGVAPPEDLQIVARTARYREAGRPASVREHFSMK
jgi:LPS sulfotransferase NodH